MAQNILIDKEFQALIPPLSAEEKQQLEANLLADGCRDPLVVWPCATFEVLLCTGETQTLRYEDRRYELAAVAKLPAPERTELIERAAAGEKVSARAPAPIHPSKKPTRALPMQLLRAVTDMVHSLGYVSVEALIESIADLPELSKAEQETLDDALDIFMSIGELVPRAVKVA